MSILKESKLLYWSLLFFVIQYANALNPIIADGNMLFDAVTNERFFVKGLGYYMDIFDLKTDNNDLTNVEACREHVELLKGTGVNLVRFYYMNYSKSHDACMQLYEKEKIYIALDLDGVSGPDLSNSQYNTTSFDRYKETIDVFDKYSNVAFYFLGERKHFTFYSPEDIAYFKANIRDVKAYIKTKIHQVLVGYVSIDSKKEQDFKDIDVYLNCNNVEERPDFVGLSTDTWCNDSDEFSDNIKFAEEYKHYGIPIFMSSIRCDKINQMLSKKFQTLLNTMDSVFSGGIAKGFYAYMNSLVKLDRNHHIVEKDTALLSDVRETFTTNPKVKHYKKDYNLKKSEPQTCPAVSRSWPIHPQLPPVVLRDECECMFKKLECIAEPKYFYTYAEFRDASAKLKLDAPNSGSFVSLNYTTGEDGIASLCSQRHRLSWMMNQYYLNKGRSKKACKSNLIQAVEEGKPETCFEAYKKRRSENLPGNQGDPSNSSIKENQDTNSSMSLIPTVSCAVCLVIATFGLFL